MYIRAFSSTLAVAALARLINCRPGPRPGVRCLVNRRYAIRHNERRVATRPM